MSQWTAFSHGKFAGALKRVRRSRSRRGVRTNHVLMLVVVVLVGCNDIKTRVKNVLVPEKPSPQTVDVLCDAGGGSSGCTSDSLTRLLREVTPDLPAGSVVRLHGMADDVAHATELARFTITASRKRTVRAVAAHREQQTSAITTQFLAAAAPLLQNDARRASPIAETIARVILAGNPTTGTRTLYVLSDGRQFSKASPALGHTDWECGHIPSGQEFAQRLRHLLPERSSDGIAIQFRFAKLEPVAKDRCPATVERYAALQETWTTALTQVGARVTWSMN